MRIVKKPKFKADVVFEDCRKIRRDKDLKARLNCIKSEISASELSYADAGMTSSFFQIKESYGVGTSVTIKEMESLYTEVFARESSPVRATYYDEIMLLPEHDTCPFCAQRSVSSLDHYLPKSKNPSLAVTPINLVACCLECNKIKHEFHPSLADEQYIHPYFDVLPSEVWLTAKVEEESPASVTFQVIFSPTIQTVISKRITWQFKKLKLAKLYTSNASKVLSGSAEKLIKASNRGGDAEVRFLLNEDAVSWGKHSINCWQAAMYRALADSDWFCNVGYAITSVKVAK